MKPASTGVQLSQLFVPVTLTLLSAMSPSFFSVTVIVTGVLAWIWVGGVVPLLTVSRVAGWQTLSVAAATSFKSAVSSGCAERLVKITLLAQSSSRLKACRSTAASMKSRGAMALLVPLCEASRQVLPPPSATVGSQTGTFHVGAAA